MPVQLGGYAAPAGRTRFKKIVVTILGSLFAIALVLGIGFYFYWQSLRSSPQYSLAMIVDAAKRDDQATVNRLVNIDDVVDDFLPQITTKAVELYGRGLPPTVLQQVARIAEPVMPAIKDRAREELPEAIKQKTSEFGYVPFEAMVLGAEQYLDITVDADSATVKSLVPQQEFEVKMKRNGSEWKIVAIKDDKLATNIAQRVGQEIIAIATDGPESKRSRLGVKNINELLNEAEKIFK
ncbi:MAG: hypothetical protein PSX80_07015 [bacterium]|nr:hypothetical protein [bacterium]